MKVLVTGGSGFIGSHLLYRLAREGYKGITVSRSKPQDLPQDSFTWFPLDLTKNIPPREIFEGIEGIIHIAGVTRSHQALGFMRGNYFATRNMVKRASEFVGQLKFFLYVSSLAAAGPAGPLNPKKEEDPALPVSFYGYSKLLSEGALRSLRDSIPWIIIRPPAVYGPGDKDFLTLFKVLKRKVGLKIKGTISVIYIDDLIDGIIKAIDSPKALNEIFFIADEKPYKIEEFASEAAKIMGSWPPIIWISGNVLSMLKGSFILKQYQKINLPLTEDKLRELDALNWVCSPLKAAQLLGFKAKTSLREGLVETIDWYKRKGLL